MACPPRVKAFTLVELLVVMGIIAILTALSFSGIMAALEASRTTACTSNLRQIGTGFNLYLSDNNNTMPQRFYGGTNGYASLLIPYVTAPAKVFVCPDHPTCTYPLEPSYGMNWYYDNVNVATITQPAQTILVAETVGSDGTGSNRADRNNLPQGRLSETRHRGKTNYLFFDGHIEKLAYPDTLAPLDEWGYDHGIHLPIVN